MINLLPPIQLQNTKAAKLNLILVRYIIILSGAFLFVLIALFVTYQFLANSATAADTKKAENEASARELAPIEAQADALRGEIDSAKTLFDSQYRYSLVLLRLSQAIPNGSALTTVNLSEDMFNEPMVFDFSITGEAAAVALQKSLTESPYFFDVTLSKLNTNSSNRAYPYTLTITTRVDRSIAQ